MRTMEKQEFITQVQSCVSDIIGAMQTIKGLASEYTALGLSTAIVDTDFDVLPAAAGITALEFKAAVTSLSAIDTFLTGAHYQNLYKVKRV